MSDRKHSVLIEARANIERAGLSQELRNKRHKRAVRAARELEKKGALRTILESGQRVRSLRVTYEGRSNLPR